MKEKLLFEMTLNRIITTSLESSPTFAFQKLGLFYHLAETEGINQNTGNEIGLLPSVTSRIQLEEIKTLADIEQLQSFNLHFTINELALTPDNPEVMDLLFVAAIAGYLPSQVFESLTTTNIHQNSTMKHDNPFDICPLFVRENSMKYYKATDNKIHFPFHRARIEEFEENYAHTDMLTSYLKEKNHTLDTAVEFRGLFTYNVEELHDVDQLYHFYELSTNALRPHQIKPYLRDAIQTSLANNHTQFMRAIKKILTKGEYLPKSNPDSLLFLPQPTSYYTVPKNDEPTLYEQVLTELIIEAQNVTNNVSEQVQTLIERHLNEIEHILMQTEQSPYLVQ
jgi:hypothetical protein